MSMNDNLHEQVSLRERMRHSASHIMADVVLRLFPEAKLAIGPPTDDGFYYDIATSRPFTPEDLQRIEMSMQEVISQDMAFHREELSRDEVRRLFSDQPFKLEIIDEIPDSELISVYRHGSFVDLCQGPHVASTGKVPAIKLLSVAGAYWRGDETRPMLQRIYGTAFETQQALDDFLKALDEAQKRDHRRLGRDLDLFFFDPISPASPFFLPKGTVVYNLMLGFMRSLYHRYGYDEVITPQIFSTDLWKRSGHYDNYRESMYFTTSEEREYGVKPMNCPAACLIYGAERRSYRDLPMRLADFGRLHRYERSGVTHGLTRVRSFSQDDAHIFCRLGQVQQEITSVLDMVRETYNAFGLAEPRFVLSLRPTKRIGSDDTWDRAEEALSKAMNASGYSFEEASGEGAFYGPKIDLFVKDAIGRDWQLSTIQLDMALPERFDLEYVAEDGSMERPVLVHRAVLGSLERFMGVLIEHHDGAFPVWLAPVQATVIPIADRHLEYARAVVERLQRGNIRADVDDRNQRMNLKIREAQLHKIPYMLVVGDREAKDGTVSVRTRNNENLGAISLAEFMLETTGVIDSKR
jgi:threonyl-tRNA synthetase